MRQYILFFGDICIFYISLVLTLLARYGGGDVFFPLFEAHALPFLFVLIFWIIIFYIGGMYDAGLLQNSHDLISRIGFLTGIGFIIAIAWFYFFPIGSIAPKINVFFLIIEICWRFVFHISIQKPRKSAAILGQGPDVEELISFLSANPHIGYKVMFSGTLTDKDDIIKKLSQNTVDIIIAQKSNTTAAIAPHVLSMENTRNAEVKDFSEVFETLLKKIPIHTADEHDIIFSLSKNKRTYEAMKRFLDLCVAIFLLVFLLPIFFLIACAIFFTTGAPALYRQTRIGKNGKRFSMYKFRTMALDAEKEGARWASHHDSRATRIGNALRHTHLDETPQLFNIIKGDMSFVGPRPERPEFVNEIRKHNPYYDTRTFVLPGLTGWAQLNYGYGASFPDVYEKLRYDLYYIKHRNIIFDILIFIKSIRTLIFRVDKKNKP